MSISLREGILAGRVAFVAGASSGINLGVALGFAEAGAKVALISRSGKRTLSQRTRPAERSPCAAASGPMDANETAELLRQTPTRHDAHTRMRIGKAGALRREDHIALQRQFKAPGDRRSVHRSDDGPAKAFQRAHRI